MQPCGKGAMVQGLALPYTQLAQFFICKVSHWDSLLSEESWIDSRRVGLNPFRYSETGFPNLSTNNIWGQIILCCGGCPVHTRMWEASMFSTYYMTVAPAPRVSTTTIISRHCQMSFVGGGGGGAKLLRNTFNSSLWPTGNLFIY